MKTGFVWYCDAVPIDGWCKYYLGINNKTGRLQWCPDMTCYKYFVIISSVMLPVAVVLVLILHMDETLSLNDWKAEINTVSNSIVKDLADGISKCIVVRVGVSENLDLEEKGLLKDVRTSFIPPESVYFPPNCVLDNEETDDDFAIKAFFLEPIDRQKRSFTNLSDDNSNDDSDDNNMDVGILAIGLNLSSEMNMSELADHNIDVVVPLDVSRNSTFQFHSFWKSEGTRENIRLAQSEIMKKYMDTTIDPCTDFYQYACGNWVKLNPIPKDKAGYDTFEMLRESLDLVLRDLLLEDTHIEQNVEKEKVTSYQMVSNISENLKYETDNNKLHAIRARKTIIKKRETLNKVIMKYEFSKMNNERIRRHLFNPQIHNKETDAETKARHLYASCMNSEILEDRGIQPILDLLQSLGGWPVLNPQWNEKEFDWLGLIAKLRLYNNDIFIVEWVGPDIKNSDNHIIQFDQTSLGLPTRDYFLHESNFQFLKAYKEFMESVMNILGASYNVSKKTAFEVVQFEIELARITSSLEDRANISILYKRMTLYDLHEIVPGIDWRRYLAIVQERSVNDSEIVVIYAIEYMKQLVVLLSKTNSTIISNYLMWRFVRHRINNLDDRFQETKQRFFHVLFGREQCPPRWKNCVGQVNSNMGMALGAMFVRKYFDENSKADTLKMTHELQEAFRDILNSTNWLDDETKSLAELKVNSMSLKIGYPDFILSKNQLNKKYASLIIDPNKYFENTLYVLHHITRMEQMKLTEIVNKTVWQTAPSIVNAYYSRNKNQIMFPAGILQPPFYHRHFPRSLNYGGIGIVIGHELTHGFDDKGRLFDRYGNIHKWWSDYAINGFHERARCLISQYANYTVSEVGIPVDGESTQGENIADNGGIRQAFHAYQNWLENNNSSDILESEILPGLNMTSKQLFFLNFAQVWCGAMRPQAMRNKLKTAVHSPGKFRVIGTISNSLDFAREFQCQPGSPMNPIHKCSIW